MATFNAHKITYGITYVTHTGQEYTYMTGDYTYIYNHLEVQGTTNISNNAYFGNNIVVHNDLSVDGIITNLTYNVTYTYITDNANAPSIGSNNVSIISDVSLDKKGNLTYNTARLTYATGEIGGTEEKGLVSVDTTTLKMADLTAAGAKFGLVINDGIVKFGITTPPYINVSGGTTTLIGQFANKNIMSVSSNKYTTSNPKLIVIADNNHEIAITPLMSKTITINCSYVYLTSTSEAFSHTNNASNEMTLYSNKGVILNSDDDGKIVSGSTTMNWRYPIYWSATLFNNQAGDKIYRLKSLITGETKLNINDVDIPITNISSSLTRLIWTTNLSSNWTSSNAFKNAGCSTASGHSSNLNYVYIFTGKEIVLHNTQQSPTGDLVNNSLIKPYIKGNSSVGVLTKSTYKLDYLLASVASLTTEPAKYHVTFISNTLNIKNETVDNKTVFPQIKTTQKEGEETITNIQYFEEVTQNSQITDTTVDLVLHFDVYEVKPGGTIQLLNLHN